MARTARQQARRAAAARPGTPARLDAWTAHLGTVGHAGQPGAGTRRAAAACTRGGAGVRPAAARTGGGDLAAAGRGTLSVGRAPGAGPARTRGRAVAGHAHQPVV